MSDRVGLVGVGAMGRALLSRLRAAGKPVQAYDIAPSARQAAKQGGAIVVASSADAARGASHIHVIVASDEQTIEAMLGADGVLTRASPGAVVFLHATIMPATTRQIAEVAAKKKVDVLDAPITAVPPRFAAGHGVFLVGGPDDVVRSARDHLLQLGETVHHFGPLGSGNIAKLAKSLMNVGERVLLAEVLNFVGAGGVDLRQFLEMQIATTSNSGVSDWERNFNIDDGHAVHRPATNLFNKDVVLAAKVTEQFGLDAPLTRGILRTADRWVQDWSKLPKRVP